MLSRQLLVAMVVMSVANLSLSVADEVRYYQENGVTYRQTKRTVLCPVTETRMQPTTQTVYRPQRSTELCDTVRTCWTPVTECRCEAQWVGRWNPFVEPYLVNRLVPRTHWQCRTEVVKVPVACCRLVPETRTVQVPVTTRRMVSEEVVTRVAVNRTPSEIHSALRPTPTPARRVQIGGLARLDNDPPRHGVSTAWRASTESR